jgi:Sulfatase-modifying factor enzyme 1/Putative metal-binding motif
MKQSIFLLFLPLFALILGGCELRSFEIQKDAGADGLNNNSSDGDTDADAGEDSGPQCIPPGFDEVCNNLDDDCDGVVDNGFDKMNDPSNCGSCGNICAEPNSDSTCVEGECVFNGCVPGFADVDPQTPGCEYHCPLYPPETEDCNNLDDDCDGIVDEVDEMVSPPLGLCRNTAGTPCSGVVMICDTRGTPGVTTWYCDYPSQVEFDPRVPNGIVLDETLCDGEDGDCDGVPDEGFTDLGQECDNGLIGSCRDFGEIACDPLDSLNTFCDLSILPDPDPLAPKSEECNGVDDNCDGIVDNADPSDPERVIDEMIHITHHGLDFYIYTYEASRADSSSTLQGNSSARSCSRPGVIPWYNVTYAEAESNCQSVGKRLCTQDEWVAACEGSLQSTYPYGDTYEQNSCNGSDYDTVPGGGNDDTVITSGELTSCVSGDGLYDMSGNLREWTNDYRGDTSGGDPVYVVRCGEFQTPWPGLACTFDLSQAAGTVILPTIGFRCCSDTAP